jgi:2-polyprenyl-3-methyl-5-hydroxy-6-metoxy-1,4-benzoquinol methylase
MRTRGRRRVIENRWRIYTSMIEAWLVARGDSTVFTVLDAGCGDGLNLVGLQQISASHGWAMRAQAVDYNPLRLERARSHAQNIPLQRASLYALPYRAGSFDVVLCSHVLEHVPDLNGALAELRRVLKPGGLLIVAVPNEGCAMGRLRNRVLQRRISRTTDHVHFFTEAALLDRVGAAGFRVRSVERETFFFPLSYINVLCTEFSAGHWLMTLLRGWFPSQAGGLITALQHG